jgi:hypothetical protein
LLSKAGIMQGVRPVVVIATFILVSGLLRLQATRRKRRLPTLIAIEQAQWAALCRVITDGRFLDRGRSRRGGGPRGTLLTVGDTLQWRPDRWETRHGDKALSWPLSQVRCMAREHRRDLSGVGYDRVELLVPDGSVVVGIFAEHGLRPESLNG